MSDFNRGLSGPAAIPADMSVDAGLRSFMLGVYSKVSLGLVVAAAFAWVTGMYQPVGQALYVFAANGAIRGITLLGWVVVFAPLVLVWFGAGPKASPRSSGIVYWAVVALMGASTGLFVNYFNDSSIFEAFLIAATAFGALSIWGYSTKRDLTGFGSFLLMGLVGGIVALVVMSFMGGANALFSFLLNIVFLFIFAGLVAYRTQQLKMTYYAVGGDSASTAVATNQGALFLFITFMNIFRTILMLMGGSRR